MKQVIKITEGELRKIIGEAINDALNEREVTRFTPYTEEQAKRNHSMYAEYYGTPEERNPAYAKAKKEAEARRKEKEKTQSKGK